MERIQGRLNFLQTGFDKCSHVLLNREILVGELSGDLGLISDKLEEIRFHLKAGIRNGAFQWVDSILVKVTNQSHPYHQ